MSAAERAREAEERFCRVLLERLGHDTSALAAVLRAHQDVSAAVRAEALAEVREKVERAEVCALAVYFKEFPRVEPTIIVDTERARWPFRDEARYRVSPLVGADDIRATLSNLEAP